MASGTAGKCLHAGKWGILKKKNQIGDERLSGMAYEESI